MNNLKAIIFDMDGILVDTEPSNLFNLYRFLKSKKNSITFESLVPTIGSSFPESWKWIVNEFNFKENFINLRQEFMNSTYNNRIKDYSKYQFPYIHEIFELCKENNIRIAVASASTTETIESVIKDNNWHHYVDCYISGFEVENNKPHPDVYLGALKRLGLKSHEVIAIEDSTHGIQAAKDAGIYTLSRTDFRFNIDNSEADLQFNDIFDIYVYLYDNFIINN